MHSIKPLKRDKNLVWLSREHHDALLLVWKIRQGFTLKVEHSRIADYILYIADEELENHFLSEEKFVFPELSVHDGSRVKAEAQHKQLRSFIGGFKQKEFVTDEKLILFANLLEEHIRFEERILFPIIQQQVSAESLEHIGNSLVEFQKNKKCLIWKDEFWQKGNSAEN